MNDKDEVIDISIISRGSGFKAGQTYTINNNNSTPTGNATLLVKTVAKVKLNFVFKTKDNTTLSDSIRWFLTNPIDTTQRITSKQICDKLGSDIITKKVEDLIGLKIKYNYFVPVSGIFNQGEEYLPINYDIKNSGILWGRHRFCDKILENYPPYSITSLTSGTIINPYNLINYLVEPSFYNENFGSKLLDGLFKAPLYPTITSNPSPSKTFGSKYTNEQTSFVVTDPSKDVFWF